MGSKPDPGIPTSYNPMQPNPPMNPIDNKYPFLKRFVEDIKIQDYLSKGKKETKDKIFKELIDYEKKELTESFQRIYIEYKKNILNKIALNLDIEDHLIPNIIENENSINVYKRKIMDEIISIKEDNSQYPINYLKILLVGRESIGKTTLIKYMLNRNDFNENNNYNISDNFVEYESSQVPYLKLVEFRGIGLGKKDSPEIVGDEALECIKAKINNNNGNRNGDYNDFFHCIWYCVSFARFEESELNLFKRLSQVYNNMTMPIIIVYTQNTNDKLSDTFVKYLQDNKLNTCLIKVLARDMEIMGSNKILKAFGREDLLKETLKKCTMALKGDMINFMTQKIAIKVKQNLLERNKLIEEKINNKVIEKFINKYNCVLNDEELKNYIADIFGKDLFLFYEEYNNKISNKSIDLLKTSNFILFLENFKNYCKPGIYQATHKLIFEKAKIFIDKQASLEKENYNMRLDNKRYLDGFKKTNHNFFQRNFDYHCQKFIIYFFIRNVCWKYYEVYRKYLDAIVESLINETTIDGDIDNYLKDCFLTKLKNFSKDYKIDIKINPQEIKDLKLDLFNEEYIIPKPIEIIDKFNEDINKKVSKIENKKNEEKWFPFKSKNFKYLSSESQNSLTGFMENKFEYQDSYFRKKDSSDNVFESIKNYQLQDLISFFESKKKYFIEDINNTYKLKNINPDKIYISKIISSKQFIDIYMNKIKREINEIKNKKELCKIDYLSIIIIGRSGVGKSTLTNAMIKEKLAPTDNVQIKTLVNKAYKSKNMPFLRIFDTRGIELDPNFGPYDILKETLKTIKKEEIEIEKSSNLNDYIQCIWYCISNNEIEDIEIEVIRELKKKEESVPIIILHTYSLNEEKVKISKAIIEKEFNDIIYIPVLADPIEGYQDSHIFGLDDLLNETLNIYKKTKKGNIYKKIKELCFHKIIKDFQKLNNLIKINLHNKIVDKFTHDFNKVLDNEDFLKYIYNLLELIFVEYMNYGEKNEKIELTQENKENIRNITNIQKYFSSFYQDYKKKSEEIIKKIYNIKAIEYLDEQVRKEKKEFSKCLNNKNKCNKTDFQNNIETFLNNNFYYLSQKYIIYRLITDAFEQITDYVEISINNLIKKLIEKNPDIFDKIYSKKIIDLEKEINSYRKNDKIYELDNTMKFSSSRSERSFDGKAAPPA